jgi:hypothetical protein
MNKNERQECQELREVTEDLMDWQVKNVNVWNNRAYDNASRVLARHAATPPTAHLSDEHVELVAKWLETQMVNTPTNGPMLANALRHAGAKGVAA